MSQERFTHKLIRWPRISLHSLRAQLFLWVALPVAVSLLALSLTEVQGHERAMQQLVQERADSITQAAAALLTSRLDQGKDSLVQLAADLAVTGTGDDTWTSILNSSFNTSSLFEAGLAIFDADGRRIAASPSNSWQEQAEILALIRQVSENHTPSSITLETSGDGILVVQGVPLVTGSDTGPLVLVGATTLESLALTDLLQPLALTPAGEVQIQTESGIQLVRLAGDLHFDLSGSEDKIVTAQAQVKPIGWTIALRESWADLVPPVLRFENIVFFVVAAAVAVSLMSAYFGLRNIVQPLQKLDVAASKVGWGDFDEIQKPVGGVQEIEELRLALARMASQVRQYQKELQSYIGAMTLGQEEERKRLARELHDETVQALIALNQQVELIERRLEADPNSAAARLRELRPLLTETIAGVRRQIQDLRPLYLEDLGFVPALEMLVRQTAQRYNLIGDFEFSGRPQRRLPSTIEISAYRIVQEALRNVAAHAQATWLHVELIFDPEGITLRVEDDGIGFDNPSHPYELAQQGHYGLLGMQERAQLHGGKVHIESEPGKGTTIEVWLAAPSEAT
jgi:signal transduction histidine kinase